MVQNKAPILLTPGPLTTERRVRQALLRDWGSREEDFIALNARVCRRLEALADVSEGAEQSHVCVPLSGSGTYALEATIASLTNQTSDIVVLSNGAYGERLATIAQRLGRKCIVVRSAEAEPIDPELLRRVLNKQPSLSHVIFVHGETSSGVINPLVELTKIAREAQVKVIVDAMITFGGIPIEVGKLGLLALVASSNKCLESVPGLAFIIAEKRALMAGDRPSSLSFDLAEQWYSLQKTGQYRFTPPVQVIAALDTALDILDEEGGITARQKRFTRHCQIVVDGLCKLGLKPLVNPKYQGPMTISFPIPPGWTLDRLHAALLDQGYAIYSGKISQCDSFRIGCMGAMNDADMRRLVRVFTQIIQRRNV